MKNPPAFRARDGAYNTMAMYSICKKTFYFMTLYTFCQIKVIQTRPCAVHLNYNMDKSVAIVFFIFLFLIFLFILLLLLFVFVCCFLFVCFCYVMFCCCFCLFVFLCCCLFVCFLWGFFWGVKLKVYSNGINGKYVEVEQ